MEVDLLLGRVEREGIRRKEPGMSRGRRTKPKRPRPYRALNASRLRSRANHPDAFQMDAGLEALGGQRTNVKSHSIICTAIEHNDSVLVKQDRKGTNIADLTTPEIQ